MTPEPGSWVHDLVELLETLSRHEVPFLIVGGYAVAHAGHLRATKDLDVFIPRAAGVDARLVDEKQRRILTEVTEQISTCK